MSPRFCLVLQLSRRVTYCHVYNLPVYAASFNLCIYDTPKAIMRQAPDAREPFRMKETLPAQEKPAPAGALPPGTAPQGTRTQPEERFEACGTVSSQPSKGSHSAKEVKTRW